MLCIGKNLNDVFIASCHCFCFLSSFLLLIIVFAASAGDKATVVKKKEEWVLSHQEKDACDRQEGTLTDCLEKDSSTMPDTQKSDGNKGAKKRKCKDDKVTHGLI